MTKEKKCFISFSSKDDEFVRTHLLPILIESGYVYQFNFEEITSQDALYEYITKSITNSDLFVCLYDKSSLYVNFEIGVALGNSKSIITIIKSDNLFDFPAEFKFTNHLFLDKAKIHLFRKNLIAKIKFQTEEIIDSTTYSLATKSDTKLIAIQIGTEETDYELELKFTFEFIKLLKKLTKNPQIELSEVSKGSLKSLLNIDLKSCADLIEKIIFFIPEFKKRKLENLKIEAEIERMNTETKGLGNDINIKQAISFVELLEKYQKLGINIQIDNQLIISQNNQGVISIKEPKLLLQ